MKTLQIVGNSKYGGGGYLLVKWCKYLSEKNWQIDVLGTDPEVINKLSNVPIRPIKNIYIPREIAPVKDILAFIQLIRLLHKEKYGVVHTYTATPSFLGRLAARIVGTPVILHHQAGWTINEYSKPLERLFYTPLEYLAALASTKSICVGHSIEKQGRELKLAPKDKFVTIPNGIDAQPFITAKVNGSGDKLRDTLEIQADHLIIGNTGRLEQSKDNKSLLEAISILKNRFNYNNIALLLAGDGSEMDFLKAEATSLGLEKNVRFLGFFENIPAFLASLDIFVSPSFREGLSISVMEAMASALPIVTTAIPPNAELIQHEKNGLLVPPRSPDDLAEAIFRFIQEPDLAKHCARNANQSVLEYYTIDRMFQETLNLYNSLLKTKRQKW